MYRTVTYHVDEEDSVDIHREDDKIQITVTEDSQALEVFIDPKHFPALRAALDAAEARHKLVEEWAASNLE